MSDVTGTAEGSQIAGMEGLNHIKIYDSELSSTITDKTASDPIANGVIIYQSTSGDADTSTGERAQFQTILDAIVRLYLEKDCSLVEINPLVETEDGKLLCLDAKVNFDDNALYRHPELSALRDVAEEDEKEYRASQFDLNYVSLDGSIGCLVNGAGLAMATMDIIQKFGGSPANFLDVGGSATTERVAAAFEILLSDRRVKAIFVNIFGGIMKCDVIAEGIVSAAKKTGLPVPLVVRLEGTNVERGREILRDSGMQIIAASDMADGARKAGEAAKGGLSA